MASGCKSWEIEESNTFESAGLISRVTPLKSATSYWLRHNGLIEA